MKKIALSLLALVSLACNLTRLAAGATPALTASSTPQFDLALTLTALLPTLSVSSTPTLATTPTVAPPPGGQATIPVVPITPIATYAPATAVPGGQVPAGAARLSFLPNATSAIVSGALTANGSVEYAVRALQGQRMEVGLVSPDNRAVLSVYAPASGQVFLGRAAGLTEWRGWLPATQDYVVRITDTGGSSTYTLQVVIPERVSFAAGAVTAQRGGPIRATEVHTYLLRALQGQTMSVSITAASGGVLLGITGLEDGQPYKRAAVGEPQYSFQLPTTQDYVIQTVSARDDPTTYTIDFRVE